MKDDKRSRIRPSLAIILAAILLMSGCSSGNAGGNDSSGTDAGDLANYLRIVCDEPDTADPQCTEGDYDIPLNVFDRLVEVRTNKDGTNSFVPSLADSWEISDDGLVYTFHLHEGVTFSNGSPLTSSDVEYTLKRLLTHPDSWGGDMAEFILGAQDLIDGKTDKLEGFSATDDLNFSITLTTPYAAFLAILSIPGSSILDEETTSKAKDGFGTDPEVTVGTGPFIFKEWNTGSDLVLTANQDCWSGAPGCNGIVMQFVEDREARRLMFEDGTLDILYLEPLGEEAEFFIRGDGYKDQLVHGRRVGLSFIALNESVEPLGDVRVRKALQLALDREALLMSTYSGRGEIENGIYPHGLIGYNEELPAIPYDPDKAAELLAEAGYPDGFELEITVDDEDTYYCREIMELASSMWEKIGVRAKITELEKNRFMELRGDGKIACYASKFSVDYNDPDSIIYIFYGNKEMSKSRSLCYSDEDIMNRVNDACVIVDDVERLKEYRELEKIIVQEDCAWIPLFSNEHYFAVNKRVKNFRVSWNGWTNTQYRDIVIEEK